MFVAGFTELDWELHSISAVWIVIHSNTQNEILQSLDILGVSGVL